MISCKILAFTVLLIRAISGFKFNHRHFLIKKPQYFTLKLFEAPHLKAKDRTYSQPKLDKKKVKDMVRKKKLLI